jgi:hypothetical protein
VLRSCIASVRPLRHDHPRPCDAIARAELIDDQLLMVELQLVTGLEKWGKDRGDSHCKAAPIGPRRAQATNRPSNISVREEAVDRVARDGVEAHFVTSFGVAELPYDSQLATGFELLL